MPNRLWRYLGRSLTLAAAASSLLVLPVAAQEDGPRPKASSPGGPIGSEVLVSMVGGLAPGARPSLSFGGLSGGYELLGRPEVTPDGVLSMTVTVPTWAEPNLVYFFFLNMGGGVRVFSDPFIVTGPGGAVEVGGTVTEVAGGCTLITAVDRTVYALFGSSEPVTVGDRLAVAGVLGTVPGAQLDGSPCLGKPGIPVRVRAVRGE